MAISLGTIGSNINNSFFPEEGQLSSVHGSEFSNNSTYNDDLPKGDEVLPPNHLLNALANSNEELLKSACKDDDDHEEVTPGISDQNEHSTREDPENTVINLDKRIASKDLGEICNQMT